LQKAKEKDKEERERMQSNEKLIRQGEHEYDIHFSTIHHAAGKRPRLRPKEDLPKPTKSMQQRDAPLDLDKNLNQTMVVANPGGRGPGQPGFFCEACKRNYRDTSAYLDHINSRSRQWSRFWFVVARQLLFADLRTLGQSTTIERSTLEQVQERIANLRAQTKERSAAHEFDFEKRLSDIREQEKEKREEKKRQRQASRLQAQEAITEGVDAEAMAIMGFAGFGTTKQA
jgi:U4/U6.U5 tri-snRNP component SNU23